MVSARRELEEAFELINFWLKKEGYSLHKRKYYNSLFFYKNGDDGHEILTSELMYFKNFKFRYILMDPRTETIMDMKEPEFFGDLKRLIDLHCK